MFLNPSGNNVDQMFGAARVRPVQMGFPAELTSSWDATNGYSWKRLGLVGVGLTDPSLQDVGDRAVTPDEDTTLTSGARGWLEPDRDATGWIFVAGGTGGGGGGSLTSGSGTLATTFGCGNGVFTTSGTVVTLPSAGTYLLTGRANFDFLVTAMGGATLVGLVGRLYNATSAAAISETEGQVCYISQTGGIAGTITFGKVITVAGATALALQGKVDVGGGTPTFTAARVLGDDSYITSHIAYVKIA